MLRTRLTDAFDIKHPIIQAPMALAAGGKLASTISKTGGLGLIGGGYGDKDWLEQEFTAAGNQQVGCGFITWSLEENPSLLDYVLERRPSAVFLSFGNPAIFINKIKDAQIPIICQIQNLRDAAHAIDLGADVIVAQGAEAGGHGESRATFTLVPEVADYIANKAPETLLCAAGGIGDGRGLAAALTLGADGAVIGSRFWATQEALVHPNMHTAAIEASGDHTIRSSVMDIARRLHWPKRYTARVVKNTFTEQWYHDLDGLIANVDTEAERWRNAWSAGNTNIANTFVGEVTGLINDIPPAADILERIVVEAERQLGKAHACVE